MAVKTFSGALEFAEAKHALGKFSPPLLCAACGVMYDCFAMGSTPIGPSMNPDAPFLTPTHTRAAFYLATGFGNKPADEISAFKLEGAAAEGGSIPAALAVAFRLLHGVDDVMPDCQKALEIYRVSLRFCVGCLIGLWAG